MTRQSYLVDSTGDDTQSVTSLLEGFRYQPELISRPKEDALVAHLSELPFKEFEFHGYLGKRRVVSFGWQYDFSGRELRKAADIPEFLLPLRARAASFAHLDSEVFQHVLVTEYAPGAGIGWHRDKAVFGQVVGISLLAPCVLRFRRKVEDDRNKRGSGSKRTEGAKKKVSAKRQWERVNVTAEPRSAYHLTGPARLVWQHSIPSVDALRYSITFRTMSED